MAKLTRRKLLCATAPLAAAAPLGAKLTLGGEAAAAEHDHSSHRTPASHVQANATMGHAAMIGEGAPAVGGPNDLDALLYPPKAQPYSPGRVRQYTLVATDEEIEIAPGVFFPAWAYNGTVPGPLLRLKEGERVRISVTNSLEEETSIHWHGLLVPFQMDGVPGVSFPGIPPGERDMLFRRFWQGERNRRRDDGGGGGAGLGLAIAQRIAETHGARLEVGDNPGGGARFTLTLPLAA